MLHRTPRGVVPTSAGEVLFERASSILRRLDELPAILKSSIGEIAGTVSLGIVASLAEDLIGPIVEQLSSTHPKVMLKSSDGDSESLCARLQAQKLDLAVVFEQDFVPTFSRTLLFSQRFFLIGKVCPARLDRPSLSTRSQSYRWFCPAFTAKGGGSSIAPSPKLASAPTVVAEADNLSSELSAVRTGIGHTILNIGELHGPIAAALAKPVIIEPPITMTCSVISSGDFNLSGAGEAVRALVADVIKSFIKTSRRPGATLIG